MQKAVGRVPYPAPWTTDTPGLFHAAGVAEPGRVKLLPVILRAGDFGLGLRRLENRGPVSSGRGGRLPRLVFLIGTPGGDKAVKASDLILVPTASAYRFA